MTRDRLDGTKKGNLLVELYLLPGRVVLWFNFMFPNKGYKNVRQTSRHARSPFMTFLYSTIFWVFLAYLIFPQEFIGALDRNITSKIDSSMLERTTTSKKTALESNKGEGEQKHSPVSITENAPVTSSKSKTIENSTTQTSAKKKEQNNVVPTNEILSQLKVGMRPRDVKKILGNPVSVEKIKKTEIWTYVISNEATKLNFHKKAFVHRLVSWGE